MVKLVEAMPKISRTYQVHKKNDPQSAYAQHILQNVHEYGNVTDTTVLLMPIHNPTKLIPYEQLFIQTFHHNGHLIDEQSANDPNPLFRLAIDTNLTSQSPQRPINTFHTNHSNQS
jgi:hypothetical protein